MGFFLWKGKRNFFSTKTYLTPKLQLNETRSSSFCNWKLFWRPFLWLSKYLFQIQHRWNRKVFLLAEHSCVLLASLQFLGLLDEELLVNQVADFAHTAHQNVGENHKENGAHAHHNCLAWLLPVQERVDSVAELTIRSIGQIINKREDWVGQSDSSAEVQVGIHAHGVANNHEITEHQHRYNGVYHQVQQVERMDVCKGESARKRWEVSVRGRLIYISAAGRPAVSFLALLTKLAKHSPYLDREPLSSNRRCCNIECFMTSDALDFFEVSERRQKSFTNGMSRSAMPHSEWRDTSLFFCGIAHEPVPMIKDFSPLSWNMVRLTQWNCRRWRLSRWPSRTAGWCQLSFAAQLLQGAEIKKEEKSFVRAWKCQATKWQVIVVTETHRNHDYCPLKLLYKSKQPATPARHNPARSSW